MVCEILDELDKKIPKIRYCGYACKPASACAVTAGAIDQSDPGGYFSSGSFPRHHFSTSLAASQPARAHQQSSDDRKRPSLASHSHPRAATTTARAHWPSPPVMLRSSVVRAAGATCPSLLPSASLRASQTLVPAAVQQARRAHAISNPTLANIEKRWEAMPPQEQADLWMALRDRMKVDWNELTMQEKKAGMLSLLCSACVGAGMGLVGIALGGWRAVMGLGFALLLCCIVDTLDCLRCGC